MGLPSLGAFLIEQAMTFKYLDLKFRDEEACIGEYTKAGKSREVELLGRPYLNLLPMRQGSMQSEVLKIGKDILRWSTEGVEATSLAGESRFPLPVTKDYLAGGTLYRFRKNVGRVR
jgi:hypothetical protein